MFHRTNVFDNERHIQYKHVNHTSIVPLFPWYSKLANKSPKSVMTGSELPDIPILTPDLPELIINKSLI